MVEKPLNKGNQRDYRDWLYGDGVGAAGGTIKKQEPKLPPLNDILFN